MIGFLLRLFGLGGQKRQSRRRTVVRAAYRGARAGYKAGRWVQGR